MKLNYRDKVILGVLLAIVIAIAGFVGLIKPKNQDIKDDEATLTQKQEEKEDLERRIAKIDPLKKNIDETYDETKSMIDDFVPYEDIDTSKEIDVLMQKYAEECGVQIRNVEIDANKETELKYYYFDDGTLPAYEMRELADINGDYALQDLEDNAEAIALSLRNAENVILAQYGIKVVGTKENLWKYLKAIENINKSIIINEVKIADWSFGADLLEEEGGTPRQPEENAEEQTEENAEQPTDENEETPEPAPAPEPLTIEATETSEATIIISLYSVYDMPKPDTEE